MESSQIIRQLVAGFAATLSMMSMGYSGAWPAPSLPKLLAEDSYVHITSDQSAWIVSFLSFGCIFGSLIGATLVDRYGRKLSLLIAIIPQIGSCILIGLADSYWWLIVARFVAGLAAGIMITVVPMYLGEIAEDGIRGALGTMLTLMSNVGILLTYCIGPWVSRAALAGFGGALAVSFVLIFIWMPESPYFLILNEKPDRAEKSLMWLRGKKSVSEEFKKLQDNVEFDQKNSGTMKDLVMLPGNRKALIIVIGLMAAQQFSGTGAILSYSSLIFEASGSTMDSSISVIIIGVVQILSGLLTVFTVDLAGRRPLLLASACGTILCLGGEALYFQLQAIGTDVGAISWLPITAIIGFMLCYSIGLGSLPYVVVSEIFPYNVKALASMAVAITGGLTGIVVTKLYQVVADAYGIHVCFWAFMVITVFSLGFIYFILPETKQRSFRSIQEELRENTKSKVEREESTADASRY